MTLYPGAAWRPLGSPQPARMDAHNKIILHTMAGFDLDRCDAYFRAQGYTGVESHFGVGFDGEIYQWVDLECRADANLYANEDAISIETADTGRGFPTWTGSNVPAWTSTQIEAIAKIVAWCCARWNIPCVLIPDSRDDRRGVGMHRQGVESVPPYQPTYRQPGGELWSTSKGKVCPGDKRVAQVPEVLRRANEILNGDDDVTPDDITKIANAVYAKLEPQIRHIAIRAVGAAMTGQENQEYTDNVPGHENPRAGNWDPRGGILGGLMAGVSRVVFSSEPDPKPQYVCALGVRRWIPEPAKIEGMGVGGFDIEVIDDTADTDRDPRADWPLIGKTPA